MMMSESAMQDVLAEMVRQLGEGAHLLDAANPDFAVPLLEFTMDVDGLRKRYVVERGTLMDAIADCVGSKRKQPSAKQLKRRVSDNVVGWVAEGRLMAERLPSEDRFTL